MLALFHIIVFPGVIFLVAFALILSALERHFSAHMQGRRGPKWYLPLADILKLFAKEELIPENADQKVFSLLPVVSLTAVVTAYLYIPMLGQNSVYPFDGDLIVIIFLLTLPGICLFLAGWYSGSIYATVGSTRSLSAIFAFRMPLIMSLLSPAMLAGTWSFSGIAEFYAAHPLYLLVNLPALFVAIVASQAELGRNPFDIAEAPSELAGGVLVEYSGRFLAVFRISSNCEMVVLASLIGAVFVPLYLPYPSLNFILYMLKVIVLIFLFAFLNNIFPRARTAQLMNFCWKYLTPLALVQLIANLILRGVLLP